MKLKVLTYNTLFAGRDGVDDRRAVAQIGLINELTPDVFLMQEAKGFDANGCAWLYLLEAQIGMRGFLALAPHTGQHVAIFVRQPFRTVSFATDAIHFHHSLATLKVALPGGSDHDPVITFMSAHLCPNGAIARQREAAYLAVQADPQSFTLLTGDFKTRLRLMTRNRKVSVNLPPTIDPAISPTISKPPTAVFWRIWKPPVG